ncbi:hypothetical protein [Flavihumibacter petaseus]|uniref:CCDC81-like prokaryotic HU domain-containing protein n=1 Tax=Flavihumibacter petaseus NBRC 106054 TaxID=1220578 RepID=A0A0E9N375_9BACT|nr:hypothetical protein [Flavihumibacter petaseus]GAO44284.1 hypothetical protein FPE01S_03_03220 [Flavihumibacter petaseus NBRC 106054]
MDILNQYLFQHRNISIPGMGTLHMDRVPARTDFVNRQLLPPGFAFRFDKYFDAPDKEFFGYLSSKMQLPDFEVIRWYNEYAYSLRAKIRNHEDASWEGLGKFYADDNGEIYFEAAPQIIPANRPVAAVRVIRDNISHQLLVGDQERVTSEMPELLSSTHVERESWWTYAIIIAAVALSICFFQFFRNGMRISSMGNSQTTPVIEMPATKQ